MSKYSHSVPIPLVAMLFAVMPAFADPLKKAAPKLADEKAIRAVLDQETEGDLVGQSVKEICAYLGENYGLAVRIDGAALKRLRPESPAQVADRQLVKAGQQANEIAMLYEMKLDIPLSRGMTVGDLLTEICTQMPGKWCYRVRNTVVLIGPAYEPAVVPGSSLNGQLSPFVPMGRVMEQILGEPVSYSAADVPLATVLEQLRKRTGANIVLDKKVAETAKAEVTGTFNDARLLTVLQLLTDMAELKVVSMNNVFYVTSAENADRLQSETNRELFGDTMPMPPAAPVLPAAPEALVSHRR